MQFSSFTYFTVNQLKNLETSLNRWLVTMADNPLFQDQQETSELVRLVQDWSGASADQVRQALHGLLPIKLRHLQDLSQHLTSSDKLEDQAARKPQISLKTDQDPALVKQLDYQVLDGPLGSMLLVMTDRVITDLHLLGSRRQSTNKVLDLDWALATVSKRWPTVVLRQNSALIDPSGMEALLEGNYPVMLHGTAFQQQVWQALASTNAGEVMTYGGLAASLGMPEAAARAVGQAVGANPIAVLIPCHRVVQADSTLGDFRWGLSRKSLLLLAERLTSG